MELLPLYILGIILSVTLNLFIVIVVLKTSKRKRSFMDYYISSLAVCNILQAGIGYLFEIFKEPKLDGTYCTVLGFIIVFLALTSMMHLTGLAVVHYAIILSPIKFKSRARTCAMEMFVILPCWVYGFVWALFPIIGWNNYVMHHQICSIDFVSQNIKDRSYIHCLITFCYAIPVIIIAATTTLMLLKLREANRRINNTDSTIQKKRRKLETNNAVMVLSIVSLYILAWTPYAVCVLLMTYKGESACSFQVYLALCSKLTTLQNPVVCICLKQYRRKICLLVTNCYRSVNSKAIHTVAMKRESTTRLGVTFITVNGSRSSEY